MDPFSIAATAFSLAGSIAKTSMTLVQFARDAHDAADDVGAVSKELQALAAVLNPISRALSRARGGTVPDAIIQQVYVTLEGCISVVEQIEENLQKYKRDKLWTRPSGSCLAVMICKSCGKAWRHTRWP
ncbi:hypothetical protein B0T25DRAFT_559454 [Lasiosphaeria hispida]|uniref:Fungal N-terminal domain-containing protein n=1 Tax=Lasiosphaeria hispida TaxID=260671 RepID=A0AAJ0H736_9PEZI|nr:hypothetical protein B0T25DRAFT_559454 [Lasiosphaeria hispida]